MTNCCKTHLLNKSFYGPEWNWKCFQFQLILLAGGSIITEHMQLLNLISVSEVNIRLHFYFTRVRWVDNHCFVFLLFLLHCEDFLLFDNVWYPWRNTDSCRYLFVHNKSCWDKNKAKSFYSPLLCEPWFLPCTSPVCCVYGGSKLT